MSEKDEHVDELMSRALDGELGGEEQARFDVHVAACDACAAEFEALRDSVEALRGRGADPLEGATVAAIVGRAMPDRAMPAAPRRRWRRPVLIVSHAAALLVGLLLAWQLGPRGEGEPTPPIERVVRVEVPVEVPVETIREVPVEVPVEVVVTERVEVPVDRIVREVVTQPVPSPLQPRLDEALFLARSAVALASTGADALGDAFEASTARIAAAARSDAAARVDRDPLEPDGGAGRAPAPRREARAGRVASADAGAALVVRREGDRVQLSTRGTLEEVVPALIDALDSGEPAVAAAALDHLEGLRADLDGATAFAEPGADRVDRAGGIRGLIGSSQARFADADDGPDAAARWRDWWGGRTR